MVSLKLLLDEFAQELIDLYLLTVVGGLVAADGIILELLLYFLPEFLVGEFLIEIDAVVLDAMLLGLQTLDNGQQNLVSQYYLCFLHNLMITYSTS